MTLKPSSNAKGAPPKEAEKDSSSLRFYACDLDRLQKLRKEAPWMRPAGGDGSSESPQYPDPKYFKSVAISPTAVTKMMTHCQSGVDKGIASSGGNPVEVMGILLGRPDPDMPRTLVVTDAFPLPIEGFETRVVADDAVVQNHMIALGESIEQRHAGLVGGEHFMGWYHSHPFDLVPHRSHCFLSQTDLSTQLQWQRAEDPHGNPFVAIVVDPLKSNAVQAPVFKAFRAYPPEYASSVQHECPDGSVIHNEATRLEYWGSCYNRYYELSVQYFLSPISHQILTKLTKNYLWIRNWQQPPSSSNTGDAASGSNSENQSDVVAKLAAAQQHFKQALGGETKEVTDVGGGESQPPASGEEGPGPATNVVVVPVSIPPTPQQVQCHLGVQKLAELTVDERYAANLVRTKREVFQ
jgi:COP9 signalosome complex subunit 5